MNDAAKEIVTGQTESAGFTLVERLLQSHAVYVRRGVGGSRHSLDAALEGEGIKNINKAVYTATPVVCCWAGAVTPTKYSYLSFSFFDQLKISKSKV